MYPNVFQGKPPNKLPLKYSPTDNNALKSKAQPNTLSLHKSFKYLERPQNIPVKIDRTIARHKTAIRPTHMPRLTVNSNANDIQYRPKNNCPKL